jgi:hypothetical protein
MELDERCMPGGLLMGDCLQYSKDGESCEPRKSQSAQAEEAEIVC